MKFETEFPKQTWITLPKPCHPETEKPNMAARWPFWKMTLLKINRLLTIYISIVPLKFEVDIQSQSKVRVWKPNNPIWWPDGHFESDVPENQQASVYGHHQHAYEIWNWNSKANLTYAPEAMSSTDRRTDGRTRWIQYTPPPTSLGGGIACVIKCGMKLLIPSQTSVILSQIWLDMWLLMHAQITVNLCK